MSEETEKNGLRRERFTRMGRTGKSERVDRYGGSMGLLSINRPEREGSTEIKRTSSERDRDLTAKEQLTDREGARAPIANPDGKSYTLFAPLIARYPIA